MKRNKKYTKIVVYTFVIKSGKILMGKRKGAFGAGFWSLPAGHIKYNETLEEACRRELKEETGMKAKNFRFLGVRNQRVFKAPSGELSGHHIIFGFKAVSPKGMPKLMEPEKCYGWQWFSLNNLPHPLFPGLKLLMECFFNHRLYLP